MPPRSDVADDFAFIMTCLKHTPAKPNFEEVAKELGGKGSSCYRRHWAIMKRHGLAGNSGRGRKSGKRNPGSTTPASGKKRPRAATEEAEESDDSQDELGGSEGFSEEKKAKQTAPEEAESKAKGDVAEDDAIGENTGARMEADELA